MSKIALVPGVRQHIELSAACSMQWRLRLQALHAVHWLDRALLLVHDKQRSFNTSTMDLLCLLRSPPRASEQGRADFAPPTGGQEWFQMVRQSMLKQHHADNFRRSHSDRFSPAVTSLPHRRRTSDHMQNSCDHEGL